MAASFFWYELMTADPAAATAFYQAVAGWTAEPFATAGIDYTVLGVGDRGVAGLMAMPDHYRDGGGKPAWFGYIHAADVDAAVAKLVEAGGSVHMGPADIPGVGRFAAVADPDGAMFSLMTPQGEDRPPLAPGTPGAIGWHELYAADGEKAFAFYAGQFGWADDGTHDMGAWGLYRLFAVDGARTGGIMTVPPGSGGPHWGFYITVDGVDAAIERIRGGGGQVVNGPHEVPGGAFDAMCIDPQGASFAVTSMNR